jgi:predicted RNase H-like HicB family nuclease
MNRKENTMKYAILIEPTSTGFSAYVPDLPGCASTGETRDETLQLMREAITFHLEGMKRHGETIPAPSSSFDYVEVDTVSLASV